MRFPTLDLRTSPGLKPVFLLALDSKAEAAPFPSAAD